MAFGFQLDNPVILQALAGCYEKTGNVALARERNQRAAPALGAAPTRTSRCSSEAKALQARLAVK